MTGSELPAAIRYLPLVPRPRPTALPLSQRLIELDGLLQQAEDAREVAERLARACEVLNKAALVASDAEQPEVAADLCWRQYGAFLRSVPLDAAAGVFALQPLVNLARLTVRAGDPQGGYAILVSLLTAIELNTPAPVLGRDCPAGGLVAAAPERAELRRFLWAVLLADGTRALCSAGQWREAVDHLHRYNGIGARLLDGRQAAVVAALHLGNPETASELIAGTSCAQAWEHAVARCLSVATRLRAGGDPTEATDAMVDAVLKLRPAPVGEVFAARLGVLAAELAPHHRVLTGHLIGTSLECDDANVASAVLESSLTAARLTGEQRRLLRARIAHTKFDDSRQVSWLTARLIRLGTRAAQVLCRALEDPR